MTSTISFARVGIVALALAAAIAPIPSLAQQAELGPAGMTEARVWPGGFQTGDRIILSVEGEKQLTDTFFVHSGPSIDLPAIGIIPLSGVRRAEIEPYLAGVIAKYVRDPVVRARSLLRIAVLGEVGKPGFYILPADAIVADALTSAGGVTREARMNKFHIDRNGTKLIDSRPLLEKVTLGATLGDLGVEPGDQLIIPRMPDPDHTLRWVAFAMTIPAAIYVIVLLFHR